MAKFENDSHDKHPVPARTGRLQIIEPRCKICQSKHRNDVDRYLAMGMSQAEVCRFFEAFDGSTFTRKSMSVHSRKHLTLHTAAVRAIIEDEAREIISNIEDVRGFLITKKAALKIGLQKSFESMMSGETLVEPDVMLKIIDKLEAWEKDELATATDEMKREFNAFANAVKFMFEKYCVQFGISATQLFDELYVVYERQLKEGAIPMLLRAGSYDALPALEIEGISDADFEALDTPEEDEYGSE